MRAGRTLDSLLSAYRLGARVVWRRVAESGEAAGLEPSTLYLVAESIFAYIDVLSAESAEGYALEQMAVAGATELAQRRLVSLLVRQPDAEPEQVQEAARAARWPLPRTLAALAIELPGDAPDGDNVRRRTPRTLLLPLGAISENVGELVCAIVPDPDAPGRQAELGRALEAAGARAGLGPAVGWPEAALSFARARAALELDGEGLISARVRAGELLLSGDRMLAAEFAADRLAPLDGLPAGSRERLTATLTAWLAEQGRLAPMAQRLGVHPQTARYRVARLRDLFGAALDDGEERFWLALALHVTTSARRP